MLGGIYVYVRNCFGCFECVWFQLKQRKLVISLSVEIKLKPSFIQWVWTKLLSVSVSLIPKKLVDTCIKALTLFLYLILALLEGLKRSF